MGDEVNVGKINPSGHKPPSGNVQNNNEQSKKTEKDIVINFNSNAENINPFDLNVKPLPDASVFGQRLGAAANIVFHTNFDDMPAGYTPEKMSKEILEGKNKIFNLSIAKTEAIMDKFDVAPKDGKLSAEEHDNYLRSTESGKKAADIYKATDTDKNGVLEGAEEDRYDSAMNGKDSETQRAMMKRYHYGQDLGKGKFEPVSYEDLANNIYAEERNKRQ